MVETAVNLKRDQQKRLANNRRESVSWPVPHWTCMTTLNKPTRDTFSRPETMPLLSFLNILFYTFGFIFQSSCWVTGPVRTLINASQYSEYFRNQDSNDNF